MTLFTLCSDCADKVQSCQSVSSGAGAGGCAQLRTAAQFTLDWQEFWSHTLKAVVCKRFVCVTQPSTKFICPKENYEQILVVALIPLEPVEVEEDGKEAVEDFLSFCRR